MARDITLVYGMNFVALAGCLAAIVRLAIAIPMPTVCFTVLLTVALSVSSFYTYLDINIAASFRSVPRSNTLLLIATWLVRLAICIPIAARAVNHQQFLWVLLFIVPPALTAPVTSMLWGGGKYLAVIGSVLLYIALPPVLGVLPYQKNYIYNNKSMTLFYVVLGAGLIFPAACAQAWRKRSPVESAKHRKEYSFLSVWALVALSFIAVYQVTPSRRGASIINNMYYPFLQQADSLECARNFWQGITVYVGMKVTAALGRKVLIYSLNQPAEHCMDMYILHTCPNIFLWLGLANSITSPNVVYTKFWAVFMFFMRPALEQNFIIKSFMHRLIRQTTQSKHITMEQLDVVWKVLESVSATCVDPFGEQVLDQEGVGAFLKYVQQLTTGVKEDVPEYMVAALFELLDADNSGFVTKSELFTYVSSVGLVIDLNGKSRSGASEKPKERILAKVVEPLVGGLSIRISAAQRVSVAKSHLDLAMAERVIAELRDSRKFATIRLAADLAQVKSKALRDLEGKTVGHCPTLVPKTATRLLALHHASDGDLPRTAEHSSIATVAVDVEMAAPPPQHSKASQPAVVVAQAPATAPEDAVEVHVPEPEAAPEPEAEPAVEEEAAPADGEHAV